MDKVQKPISLIHTLINSYFLRAFSPRRVDPFRVLLMQYRTERKTQDAEINFFSSIKSKYYMLASCCTVLFNNFLG
jgi:hypothetical protein